MGVTQLIVMHVTVDGGNTTDSDACNCMTLAILQICSIDSYPARPDTDADHLPKTRSPAYPVQSDSPAARRFRRSNPDITDHIRVAEPRCPVSIDLEASDEEERASCPFFMVDSDPVLTRQPQIIKHAVCNCTRCRSAATLQYHHASILFTRCQYIYRYQPVIYSEGAETRTTQEKVSVGCRCVHLQRVPAANGK